MSKEVKKCKTCGNEKCSGLPESDCSGWKQKVNGGVIQNTKITITQRDKNHQFLGAYLVGSIKDGEGIIQIDFEGVESENLPDTDKKQILLDAIMHELHHAMSDHFGFELKDPDGLCGGTDNEVMVIVPLDEHQRIISDKDKEIERLKNALKECLEIIQLTLIEKTFKPFDRTEHETKL